MLERRSSEKLLGEHGDGDVCFEETEAACSERMFAASMATGDAPEATPLPPPHTAPVSDAVMMPEPVPASTPPVASPSMMRGLFERMPFSRPSPQPSRAAAVAAPPATEAVVASPPPAPSLTFGSHATPHRTPQLLSSPDSLPDWRSPIEAAAAATNAASGAAPAPQPSAPMIPPLSLSGWRRHELSGPSPPLVVVAAPSAGGADGSPSASSASPSASSSLSASPSPGPSEASVAAPQPPAAAPRPATAAAAAAEALSSKAVVAAAAADADTDTDAQREKQSEKPKGRQQRGSLFARISLGSPKVNNNNSGATAAAAPSDQSERHAQHAQQLGAMSSQLEALAATLRAEQVARCEAEERADKAAQQVLAMVAQLNEVQRLRVETEESLRGMQGLVATLRHENQLLQTQNTRITDETREFIESHRSSEP